jgi:hypothetical protein
MAKAATKATHVKISPLLNGFLVMLLRVKCKGFFHAYNS